jgi:gliding motility-associated lipoprotein GldH
MYSNFISTGNAWHQDSIIRFEVQVEDVSIPYRVTMKIRHNADYPYQNLYIFRTIMSAQGLEYTDTVNLLLADDQGNWLGEGLGELKTMSWAYNRKSLQFKESGNFTFTLQQGMRDEFLKGITDVGLEIYPVYDSK